MKNDKLKGSIEDDTLYICDLCSTVLNGYDTVCKKCGAKFDEKICICPACKKVISAESKICKYCGAEFGVRDSFCPVCSARISSYAERCYNCGAEFMESIYKCGKCGTILRENSKSCPVCKVELKEEKIEEVSFEERTITYDTVGTGAPVASVVGGSSPSVTVSLPKLEVKTDSKSATKARTERLLFPFTAIIGQEKLKLALLLNAINPDIGGVLIKGEKGTGKSVAVRGLSELLPPIQMVSGCRFRCDPAEPMKVCWECKDKYGKGPFPTEMQPMRLIELPVNATEDRLLGTLNLEKILTEGLAAFEHGLLGEANRGILYVDEINLLDNLLVDALLDSAAMGVVTVERETISITYPAKYILVGSMNPEEGKLRPQLLDRIALQVEVKGLEDSEQRLEVIRLRNEALRDLRKLREKYEPAQAALRAKIITARQLLPRVKIPEKIARTIPKASLNFGVDGHRADLAMEATIKTKAAFDGRTEATIDDLMLAAEFVLPHRMRKGPFEERAFDIEELREIIKGIV